MTNDIRAITLDLDDTLWPVDPVIESAEQQLHDWLAANCPEITERHTVASMRELRLSIVRENAAIAHDMTEVRRRSLARLIVQEAGYPPRYVEHAMEVFLEHRNRVELFPDALPFLEQARRFFPLLSISNGNADPERIGLGHLFVRHVSAIEVGAAKPDARLFHAACDHLGVRPGNVLHIGDHPVQDILGAARAGMRTVWLNRSGAAWAEERAADHEVASLEQVLGLLPSQSPGESE